MHNLTDIYTPHTHVCTINSVTVYRDIKQSINVGTLNKSRKRNHSAPCCGTDIQWPSYAWCSLPYSLTHPLLYHLQLPQEITVSHTCHRKSFLTWTWNYKLWFGLSRLVNGGPYRHCTVFSVIYMSILCFSAFPTALRYFTLCLYRLWSLPKFISGYYTLMLTRKCSLCSCCMHAHVSVCSVDELRLCGYCYF
jgi:hypothetical protein